jgi:hypothetical protein
MQEVTETKYVIQYQSFQTERWYDTACGVDALDEAKETLDSHPYVQSALDGVRYRIIRREIIDTIINR